MPPFISALLTDPKFWFAVYAVAQAALKYFAPNFPPEILTSIDALVAVVLAGLAGNSAVKAARAAK